MYINLLTEEYIPDSAVIRDAKEGLTIYEDGCWKLLAPNTYRKINEEHGSASFVNINTLTDKMGTIAKTEAQKAQKKHFYTEYFGMNDLIAEQKKYTETSGVISDPIDVAKNIPIKVFANVAKSGLASTEFSIIDGSREIPIMLSNEDKVMHERLFFCMPLRFLGSNITYYNNGEPVDAVTDEMRVNGTATACYIPDKSHYTYTPQSNSIRIKIVIRMPKASDRAPEISNIRIERQDG